MNEQVCGIVEEIIFQNEDSGFVIAVIESDDMYLTVKGVIPFVKKGQMMRFFGKYTEHLIYGEQFDVSSSEIMFPMDKNSIIKYLSSGLISGVGEIMAQQIVDMFGDNTLEIIDKTPNKLTEVKGIGKKKAEKIAESFRETKAVKEVMMFLQQYGISSNRAMSIYKVYGNNAKNRILKNPYSLVDDVDGIGFKTADEIAKKIGIEADAPERIVPAINYILSKYTDKGDTYVLEEELITKTSQVLSVSEELVRCQLGNSLILGKVTSDVSFGERRIYLPVLHYAEMKVCQKIFEIASFAPNVDDTKINARIQDFQARVGIELAQAQKKAVLMAASEGMLVITGGPGTGKTTIINAILDIFESRHMKVFLAAPTGRAAKRMTETTGREAKTIHRLLEYVYSETEKRGLFTRTEDNPLECDVLIVDETSMMDIQLMKNLLVAVKKGTQLVFVGDVDQLPSVGAGSVLKDIISSEVVSVIRLTEIYRQSEESFIAVNAHRINAGHSPYLNEKDKDFFFIESDNANEISKIIGQLVNIRLPNHYGFNPIDDIQVLSPIKRGVTGVMALNEHLQNLINPIDNRKDEVKIGTKLFRTGDKIMQIKNDYNMKWKFYEEKGDGVFNGDLGRIEEINHSKKQATIYFDDDRRAIYEFSQMDMLMHAYAITVHKSQGSEFPVVVMPIYMGAPMLMNRNILYTALTRAKKLVVLVGNKRTLKYMIDNDMPSDRKSGLIDRLIKIKKDGFVVEDKD